MSKRVKPGDLIGIPVEDCGIAVALVLHVSKYFGGAMMIGIYNRLYESWDDIDLDALPDEFIATPNYTATRIVTSGEWKRLGNSPELLAAAEIPELLVSYDVFYKDEVRRRISPDERAEYTELSGQGAGYIEEVIRRHFANR